MSILLRAAAAADGEAIAALVGVGEWRGLEAMHWNKVGPNWIVAEHDGAVVGCICMLPAAPVGHLEHMGLSDALDGVTRGRVVSALLRNGWAMLKAVGCELVMAGIPEGLDSYIEVLRRRGAVELHAAKVMIKRLV